MVNRHQNLEWLKCLPKIIPSGQIMGNICTEKAKELFYEILNDEKNNEIPQNVFENAKNQFDLRNEKINWLNYYNSLPFNTSALALYEWSPIADELKTLDKKIVLNSMILKWDLIKEEFKDLINF